jgi:hypothetical protein
VACRNLITSVIVEVTTYRDEPSLAGGLPQLHYRSVHVALDRNWRIAA